MKHILTLSFSLFIFYISHSQTILAEHHFESKDITEVSVSGSFCDVDISHGDRVVFDGRIEGSGEKDDFVIASIKSGNKVLFKVESKSSNWWNGNKIEEARLSITVPNNVTLKVDNSSGDVRVNDLGEGSYQIETTSGDIRATGLTGTASISSTSGDIDIRGLTGEVTVRSTSGDQQLESVTGSLNTRSTSGDIDIAIVQGDLQVGATSGDVEIRTLRGTISVETTSGNILARDIDLTGDSNVKASSGDVSFRFKNNLEDIGFELKASSGNLEVGPISAEGHLSLSRGNMQVTGITTSGDQEYDN